jgi:YVTN family beta-propeller protein
MDTRVSLVNLGAGGGGPTSFDLNPHINRNAPAGSDDERAQSLALPADIVRGVDGSLYVAATGSGKVGVLNSSGVVRARIAVGQGPTGLALEARRNHLYVLNRFDETLSVVDLNTRAETGNVPIGFDPEAASVRQGRCFHYDASLSAHGDLACASCHPNGHRDGLAWDLGDPQGSVQIVNSRVVDFGSTQTGQSTFHPMQERFGSTLTHSNRDCAQ